MSHSPMDLDSSLDDLIKKRRQSKPHANNNNKKQQQQSNKNKQQQQTRPSIQTKKAKVTKPTPQRSGINSRLSTTATSTPSGPLFTAKNTPNKQPQKQRTDPSKIIITKAIPTTSPKTHSLHHRLGGNHNRQPPQHEKPQQVKSVLLSGRLNTPTKGTQPTSMLIQRQTPVAVPTIAEERVVPFSIRGRSTTGNARPLTIKGESGPTTILVSGLDPMTNSEDVKVSLEGFGNILHCEVLRDRGGRSFGEAEVEFSTKSAALDCIAQLDNQLVDDKFLRVILREPKPKQQFSAVHQIRSIIQPSYSVSGKMYSDQMTPRYDINRQ